MVEFGPDEAFEAAFRDLIVGRLDRAAAARSFPIGAPLAKSQEIPLADHLDVFRLDDHSKWDDLNRHFRQGVAQNYGPWNRCLVALRVQGARVCVVERHYVCLDHRSEHAAFHSSLDATNDSVTTRLHFFRKDVGADEVLALSAPQRRSYLGYIVCRRYGLPLVGRALIRKPDYIQISADVEESVNFFGQRLEVRGVPFMQQDTRYANCAHAAAWSILYTAYRRGLSERRLISDIVAASASVSAPMQPQGPAGLSPRDVQDIFQVYGLGTTEYLATPEVDYELPRVPGSALPGLEPVVEDLTKFAQEVARRLGVPKRERLIRSFDANAVEFASDVYKWTSTAYAHDPSSATSEYAPRLAEATKLVDRILAAVTEPYLRSGFPLYCSTIDHAFVLCGISWRQGEPVFYFNDDQLGPYLASTTLIEASFACLQWQSYVRTEDTEALAGRAPRLDRSSPSKSRRKWQDEARGVRAFIVPGPRRLLLSPTAAETHVRNALRQLISATGASAISIEDFYSLKTSVLMGIDYKGIRRAESAPGSTSRRVFSTLHLAEWIVLVEGRLVGGDGQTRIELAYDGTSSDARPILQFARIGRRVVAVHPRDDVDKVQSAEIESEDFPPMQLPTVVGKARAQR